MGGRELRPSFLWVLYKQRKNVYTICGQESEARGLTAEKRKKSDWRRRSIRPERVLVLGFFALIVLGTILLSLPIAAVDGRSHGVFNGAFTATSAVCVTGLITLDTATSWSVFGKVVIISLIQLGGLGFMVFATLIMVALGRRITLRERMVIKESMNATTLSGLIRLSMLYGLIALLIELFGAALLAVRFVPQFGWQKGVLFSLFHSVSAFCNAGFDLFGNFQSLTAYQSDAYVLLTISALILLGGLGFSVIFECVAHRFRWRKFSLHARLVLIVTGGLLIFGTIVFCLLEWNNEKTLGSMGVPDKLLNAFFQSVTLRTAGFNSVDQMALKESSKLMGVLNMFIGASPASTGGGVKTTTMSVLLLVVISVIRGHQDVNVMKKRLAPALVKRALAILFIAGTVLIVGAMALTVIEGDRFPFLDLLYEAASAVGTVGISSIGTPNLTLAGQILLIPLMFLGRVGPLTIALALAYRQDNKQEHVKFPEDSIVIG